MKLTTALAFSCLIVLLGAISQFTRAADPADPAQRAATTSVDPTADIPHLPPKQSTAFACDMGIKNQVVAVVVSYSDGSVVRFDAYHMHGFTVQQLMAYHDTAPDSRIYLVPCKPAVIS